MRAAWAAIVLFPATAVGIERLELPDGRTAIVGQDRGFAFRKTEAGWRLDPQTQRAAWERWRDRPDVAKGLRAPLAKAPFLGSLYSSATTTELRIGNAVKGDGTRELGSSWLAAVGGNRTAALAIGLYRLPTGWFEFRPGELRTAAPVTRPTPSPGPPRTASGSEALWPAAAGLALLLGTGGGFLLGRRGRRAADPDPAADVVRRERDRLRTDLESARHETERLRAEVAAVPPDHRQTAERLRAAEEAITGAKAHLATLEGERAKIAEEVLAVRKERDLNGRQAEELSREIVDLRSRERRIADDLAGIARAFGAGDATSRQRPEEIVEMLRQRAVSLADQRAGEASAATKARELLDRTEAALDTIVRPADPEATAPFEAVLRFAAGEAALALATGDEAALDPALLDLRALTDGAAARDPKLGPYADWVRTLGDPGDPPLANGAHRHAVTWGARILAVRTGRFPLPGFGRLHVRGPQGTHRIAPPN